MKNETDPNLLGYERRHAESLRQVIAERRNPQPQVVPEERIAQTFGAVDEYLSAPEKWGGSASAAEARREFIKDRDARLDTQGLARTGAAEYDALVADARRAWRADGRLDSDFNAKAMLSVAALKTLADLGKNLRRDR